MLDYSALPADWRASRIYFVGVEPVLPKKISPLSCVAQPSAFSSSSKFASWLPGSFVGGVLIFHCQLSFFVGALKYQLLSAKLLPPRCGLSLVLVLRLFSQCPRPHLLPVFLITSYRND